MTKSQIDIASCSSGWHSSVWDSLFANDNEVLYGTIPHDKAANFKLLTNWTCTRERERPIRESYWFNLACYNWNFDTCWGQHDGLFNV